MIKLIPKILLIIFISLSNIKHIYADYGSSCDQLPNISNLYELENYTWYGLVKNSVDSTKESVIPLDKRCNINPESISICVRNMTKELDNTFPSCDLLTFSIGDTKKIFSPSSFTFLAPDSLLETTLAAESYNGQLCLMMKTIKGEVPVVCKGKPQATPPVIVKNCKLSPSCYDPGENKSKAIFNFSGMTYNCVKNSLQQLFYSAETCVNQDTSDTLVDTANLIMAVNPFASFQIALRQSVIAVITLYLIMFGMKMLTDTDEMNLEKYAGVVLNIILVMYFSIGLGKIYFLGSVGEMFNDGMTQLVLPFLLSLSHSLTDIVFKAGGSQGLCYFDPYTYPTGYSFYALWDSIDCRFTYYLAGSIMTLIDSIVSNVDTNVVNIYQASDEEKNQILDALSDTKKTFEFFVVLIPMLLGSGITIVVSMIAFGVMFIGLSLNLLTVCIVSLVCLYFITYLAPLFVPMVLFERTKGYFDAWWKLLVSFALRPVIIAGFVSLTLTIIDTNFYGNCEFELKRIYLGETLGTANIYSPVVPDFEPEKCTRSVGMKLKDIYAGKGMWTLNLYLFKLHIWTDVLNFALDMAKMAIVGYLMYYFMQNVEGLSAELTGSQISISSMVISANSFVKKGAQIFGKGMNVIGLAELKAGKFVARKTGATALPGKVGTSGAKAAGQAKEKLSDLANMAGEKALDLASSATEKASKISNSVSQAASNAASAVADSKLEAAASKISNTTSDTASEVPSSIDSKVGRATKDTTNYTSKKTSNLADKAKK